MTPELAHEDHRSSAEIESEIRKTRGRMDSTLDELGNRLTARSLLNSALDWWDAPDNGNQGSAALKKATVTLARQVRQHPMPSLLIGAGVAWLVSESMADDDEPARVSPNGKSTGTPGQWAEDKMEDAKGAAASAVDTVRDKSKQIGEKLHVAKDRLEEQAHVALDKSKSVVRHVGEDLKGGYHAAEEKFTQACDEYPLAVGVAFAALGALAGLVIPRTRREDELMGERSDELVDETKEKANELLQAGKEVGSKVLQVVKEEAREQGLTPEGFSETLSDLKERGSQVLQKAKEEAIHTAEDQGVKISSGSPDKASTETMPDNSSEGFSDDVSESIKAETSGECSCEIPSENTQQRTTVSPPQP